MITNYIFDFGNVLARFDPRELTAACVKDPAAIEPICAAVFDRAYWDRLDAGRITDAEVKADLRRRLPAALQEPACRVYDSWIQNLPPMEGMSDLLSEIKAWGGRLYLLSNISKGFAETYDTVPWIRRLFSQFDGLVFSGLLGMTKPSREIFAYLLEAFRLPAAQCGCIDDSAPNLVGAAAAGICGYHFDGDVARLRAFLQQQRESGSGREQGVPSRAAKPGAEPPEG